MTNPHLKGQSVRFKFNEKDYEAYTFYNQQDGSIKVDRVSVSYKDKRMWFPAWRKVYYRVIDGSSNLSQHKRDLISIAEDETRKLHKKEEEV